MSRVLNLAQGTPEWLKWRKDGIGGSDAPAVMGVSPYKTPRQLWMEKVSANTCTSDEGNEFIFAKGHSVEKQIREDYFAHTGIEMISGCFVHPKVDYFRASLDGYNEKRGVLEAKLVGQKALEEAKKGNIPEHHLIQMQHQFMVTGAEVGDYFCHNGKNNGVLLEIRADSEYINRIVESEHYFWAMVKNKTMPCLTHSDYVELDDPDYISMIRELKEAKKLADNAQLAYEKMKKNIIGRVNHPKILCDGLRIYKAERRGSIDYSRIPEVQNLSEEYLEQFRKDPVSAWTVEFIKQKRNKAVAS